MINLKKTSEYDFIIVGTGMGGSAIGYALAKLGAKILFLEKGFSKLNTKLTGHLLKGDYPEAILKKESLTEHELLRAGRNSAPIYDHNKKRNFIPFIGCGTGGSSALYGMALERLFPSDFSPAKNFNENQLQKSSLPESWPIKYKNLLPYYEKVEKLFKVVGSKDPLRTDPQHISNLPRPFTEANKKLLLQFQKKGLHPYHIPTACDFDNFVDESQGFLDNRNTKNDAENIFLKPAIEKYGADLIELCEVVSISSNQKNIKQIKCHINGQTHFLKCHQLVLASGALATTKVLLCSANQYHPEGLANASGQVGKNMMRHYIDLYSIKIPTITKHENLRKQLAFNDFYLNSIGKFGTFQSFGHLPNTALMIKDLSSNIKSKLFKKLFGCVKPLLTNYLLKVKNNRLTFASIMEDLPYEENSISWCKKTNQLTLNYEINKTEKLRIQQFRNIIKETLKPLTFNLIKQVENNERIAHVCGTARFGDDPAKNVLNKNNRSHDIENLYIVDSSFFPSSGGTNPSCTIAANALRVADIICAKEQSSRSIAKQNKTEAVLLKS